MRLVLKQTHVKSVEKGHPIFGQEKCPPPRENPFRHDWWVVQTDGLDRHPILSPNKYVPQRTYFLALITTAIIQEIRENCPANWPTHYLFTIRVVQHRAAISAIAELLLETGVILPKHAYPSPLFAVAPISATSPGSHCCGQKARPLTNCLKSICFMYACYLFLKKDYL